MNGARAASQHATTRIVLPGGAGLVGQNLVVRLKARGYTDLVVLDKHPENTATMRRLHPDLTIEEADLSEPGAWTEHFRGADAVVMLQAQISAKDETPFRRNNLTSTERILEAIQRHRVPHTVHVSSSVVQSVADDPYARTKTEQERLFLSSGVPGIVLRPTLMFGWFDRKHLGWLARFMRRVPLFPIPGHGRYLRQPLYVGDFCEIIANCLAEQHQGGCYDISGVERIDYIDLIRALRRATGARCVIAPIPYGVFAALLRLYAVFSSNPPFTVDQLRALTAGDEFEVIDWPGLFEVRPTPLQEALHETFNDPHYSGIELSF
ncbi:MAG: NAD-dependent epimerase/dehydratase family protein [Halorhodospira sp.]